MIYRSTAGSPHELSAKKAEWVLFSRPIFSGCINFLEALSTVLLCFTSTPQQAGNRGKEGNPEPGSNHAQAAWPCCTASIPASWENCSGRWQGYLLKISTLQVNFHVSVSLEVQELGNEGRSEVINCWGVVRVLGWGERWELTLSFQMVDLLFYYMIWYYMKMIY